MKRVTFLVGPNGCGKTRQLASMAESSLQSTKTALAIANTPFVRFPRSRNGFQVLRISPLGINKVVSKNLESFFDKERRDTFEISDLLKIIGFHQIVELEIEMGKRRNLYIEEITSNKAELDAINSGLEIIQSKGKVRFELSNSSDSFQRSLRGRNRIIFKYIADLSRTKTISSFALVFHHQSRGHQKFHELSSGEQTLISTYLFIKAQLNNLGKIFIDEPENSLHPEWQRQYIEMLHMALGYHDVKIFLATHSPVLVSGALAGYNKDVEIIRVDGRQKKVLEINNTEGPESVEEILWQAFDTLTPVSHFLSVELSSVLQRFTDRKLSKQEARVAILEFLNRSYDPTQKSILENVIKKIDEFSSDV